MRPCSAAWTVPSSAAGSRTRGYQRVQRDRVPARASGVVSASGGRSRSHTSITAAWRSCSRWYACTRFGHLDRADVAQCPDPIARLSSIARMAMSVVDSRLRVLGAVARFEPRDVVDLIEARPRGIAALVEVQRARMRGGETRARRRRYRSSRSVSSSTSWYSTPLPLRSPDSRSGAIAPGPVHLAAAWVASRSSCTSSRTISSRPSPNQRVSAGSSGQLVRRARDLRAEHEQGCRGSPPPARGRRRVSSSG